MAPFVSGFGTPLAALFAWTRPAPPTKSMIFKAKDPISDQLRELELALQRPLPDRDRQRLEKELAQRRAGLKGEEEAAYHINFHLRNPANWAVIHDLRIEWKGRTAQIDHLLISRLLEIYVVESKSFRTKVRYANGGWERLNFSHWEGIPCPVTQNERHIAVLKDLIDDLGLAPKRFGMSIPVTFRNIVVVRPSCSVIGDFKGDARIWRMDTLVKQARDEGPSALDVVKIISQETLYGSRPNWRPFTSRRQSRSQPPHRTRDPPRSTTCPSRARRVLPGVRGRLSSAEVRYCRQNEARFAGGLLCRNCQRDVRKATPANVCPCTTPLRGSRTAGLPAANVWCHS